MRISDWSSDVCSSDLLAVLFSNDVAPDANTEPLMIEELFLMIPEHSRLVPRGRKSITIVDAAALPLILPTGAHGLRQRIAAEFETPRPNATVVAEQIGRAWCTERVCQYVVTPGGPV